MGRRARRGRGAGRRREGGGRGPRGEGRCRPCPAPPPAGVRGLAWRGRGHEHAGRAMLYSGPRAAAACREHARPPPPRRIYVPSRGLGVALTCGHCPSVSSRHPGAQRWPPNFSPPRSASVCRVPALQAGPLCTKAPEGLRPLLPFLRCQIRALTLLAVSLLKTQLPFTPVGCSCWPKRPVSSTDPERKLLTHALLSSFRAPSKIS